MISSTIDAEAAMIKERDVFIDELYESYEEYDGDDGYAGDDWVKNRTNHTVYGKPKHEYIEIRWGDDYEAQTETKVIYIKIEEKEIQ